MEKIKILQPDELQEVKRAVNGLLTLALKDAEREAALRVLEESGLVRQVKRPPMVAQIQRPPVLIQGKPLRGDCGGRVWLRDTPCGCSYYLPG